MGERQRGILSWGDVECHVATSEVCDKSDKWQIWANSSVVEAKSEIANLEV